MTTDPGGFSDVDGRDDADRFVTILEAQDRMPGIAGVRAAGRAMLRAQVGEHILDAGCGTGTEARALAEAGVSVTAIDLSDQMLAVARARTAEGMPVTYARGDVTALEAADDAFDGARSERVLQHVADPDAALAELIRVVRPGGRVVVLDTDWSSLTVAIPDDELVEAVRAASVSNFASPTIGRRLYGLFRAALDDVSVEAHPLLLVEPTLPGTDIAPVDVTIEAGLSHGAITVEQAERIRALLTRVAADGAFLASLMMYVVGGTVRARR